MPETKIPLSPTGTAAPLPASIEPRRFDSAHSIRGRSTGDSRDSERLDQVAAQDEVALDQEGLQRHAEELAEQLRKRQIQIDRREAQLNTQLAKSEHDVRLSRLWIQDREAELVEKAAQLDQRQNELEQQVASFSAAELASRRELAEQEKQIAAKEGEVQQREARLVEFQQRLQEQQQWLGEESQRLKTMERQLVDRQHALQSELHVRGEQLAAAEKLLQQQAEAAEAQRTRKQTQQDGERNELAKRQAAFSSEQKRASANLAEQRRQLERRSVSLDEKQRLVQETYERVQAAHQEALELRLIGEQVWARLSSAVDANVLSGIIQELQTRLGDQNQLANQHAVESKDELRQIGLRLAEKDEEIRKRQADLKSWLERRQHEIEEQAARLVAREQELSRQERRHIAEREQWDAERQQVLAKIRKLVQSGGEEVSDGPQTFTGKQKKTLAADAESVLPFDR